MGIHHAPSAQGITSQMIESLEQTRPWVRFLSILGFVGTVLMVLAALLMMVVGGAGMIPGAPRGGGGAVLVGIVYLLVSLFYLFPSLFLFRYASGISSMDGDTVGGMERALTAQKSFWRFVGIVMLVYLVLLFIVIAFAVVAAIIGAMR
jgi:hypothetical protein